jgi:hypothetical protein
MNKSAMTTGVVATVIFCATQALAQMPQKGSDEKAASQQTPAAPQAPDRVPEKMEQPKEAAPAQPQPRKGAVQAEPKEKSGKGATEKSGDPKERPTKDTAQKPNEQNRAGTAQQRDDRNGVSARYLTADAGCA